MANEKPASGARKTIGDIAPKLAEITEDVLFGDVWERPQLSKRDRSLVTCAALVATGKTEQMDFHFPRAIENGVTQEELVAARELGLSNEPQFCAAIVHRRREAGPGGKTRVEAAVRRTRCAISTRSGRFRWHAGCDDRRQCLR